MSTSIPKEELKTEKNLENILVTHNEQTTIMQDESTTISYRRLNHIAFNYQMTINNPRGIKKKVIVRLWLGLSKDMR